MPTLWFLIVALMLVTYVILDGFDIGAGIIHLIAGRTDRERRIILRSIGPVWDGNEVWLLAAGGTLYFAFPLLYASSFSGFYLPLMMVLWLLMLRAIGIEFRTHLESPVWRAFFDVIFSVSSVLLAIFFGAALGNVVRGVPLDEQGYFFEPLWTNWLIGPEPGILDWFTVMSGVVALVTLTIHGSLYVAHKTVDDIRRRARRIALCAWPALLILTFVSLMLTIRVHLDAVDNYRRWPIGLLIPVLVFGSLALMLHFLWAGRDKAAFLCSSAYIAGMLGGAAFGIYPDVLPAAMNKTNSLTIYNTAAAHHGLFVGLVWWSIGIVIAIAYFTFIYRMFKGKVVLEPGEGH
ncbi:MAG: cytochrome d ubiquinol oxidase subunit II [Terriglobales bacterium]